MRLLNPAKRVAASILTAAGLAAASPALAQVESVDPDAAYDQPIDGDLQQADPVDAPYEAPATNSPVEQTAPDWSEPNATETTQGEAQASVAEQSTTYREDDLIGAAEGVFGDGAREVAGLIQRLLKDQGEPNAYIAGREASGAFVVGARYGSGTLYHKVEGERPVYWTGPSIGFDAGANAGSTFVLVYNLYDTEELYERFPAGEGQLYAIGGMTASYLRKGDVVLIPIRVGAGLRLGVNAGYMKFSKKQRWLPF